MLTDLAAQVNNPVIVYLLCGTGFRGTLVSCDPAGVTKLSSDDGFNTTKYEFLSSQVAGFATQSAD